jgi:O-antigen/teichoic acid export membrane protein
LVGAGRLDVLRARYRTAIRVLALMLFPLCLGLSSLIPVVLPFVYGQSFAAAVPSAMVLVASASLAFTNVATAATYGLELSSFTAIVGSIGAVAAVFAGVMVIPSMGVWGAAWSRAAIQSAMVAAGLIYLWKSHQCRFPFRDVSRTFAAAIACAASSAAIVWTIDRFSAVFLAIPVAAVVYVVLVRMLDVVKPEDLGVIRDLTGRLPAPLVPVVVALLGHFDRGALTAAVPAGEPQYPVPPVSHRS